MRNLSTVMEKLEKIIRNKNINCLDIVGYQEGEWETRQIIMTLNYMNCFSVAKTFTATAVGIAQDQGLLNVDDAILSYIGTDGAGTKDPAMKDVTVRHLLTHTMGIEKAYLHTQHRNNLHTDDWLSFCLSQPLGDKPGERFMYSNSNFYLLSRIISKVSGKTMDMFLYEHLFKPLDITDYAFTRCPRGEVQGGTGMFAASKDMAKLGVLYMHEGMWEGRCILSKEWVREATRNQTSHILDTRYGFGMGVFDEGFCFMGALMQFVVVRKDLGLVLAGHSCEENTDVLELINEAIA